MTQVRFRPKRADGTTVDGVILTESTIVAEPDKRSDLPAGELMPVGLVIEVAGVEITRTFPPNDLPYWVWRFIERYPDGQGGTVELISYRDVPAVGSVLDFEDLTIVDPQTLSPLAEPEAAWWTALNNAVIGGGGGGSVTASQITDSTVVGRAVITAGTAAAARTAINAANLTHTHPIADIAATGAPSASTYLRGDGSWQIPDGAGGVSSWDDLTDKPAVFPTQVAQIVDAEDVGKAVMLAVDAATARTALDALGTDDAVDYPNLPPSVIGVAFGDISRPNASIVLWISDTMPINATSGDVWLNGPDS
jgi:hypothetical protein